MIEYIRGDVAYKFGPLPANLDTATIYLSMAKLSKKKKGEAVDMAIVAELVGVLPRCIARSMRDYHTEDEINAFIDTILLDFGDPSSFTVIGELNMLFMGLDPTKVVKDVSNT